MGGASAVDNKEWQSAEVRLSLSLRIGEFLQDDETLKIANFGMARLYRQRGNLSSAKDCYLRVLDIASKVEDQALVSDETLDDRAGSILMMNSEDEYFALTNLSSLYMQMGQITLAGSYYERAAD